MTTTMQINTKPEFMQVSYAACRSLGLMNVTIQTSTASQQMREDDVERLLDDISDIPSLQSVQIVGCSEFDAIDWCGFGSFADSVLSRFRMKSVGHPAMILKTRLSTELILDDTKNRVNRFDVVKVVVNGTDPCSEEIMRRLRFVEHPNVHLDWSIGRSMDEVRLLRENWKKWQQSGLVQSINIVPSPAARKDSSFWEAMADQMALLSLDFARMDQEKRIPYLDGRQEQPLQNIVGDPEGVKQIAKYPCYVKNVSCFVTPSLDVFPCSFVSDTRHKWTWKPNPDGPGRHGDSFVHQHAEHAPGMTDVGYCNSTCRKRCEDRNFQLNIASAVAGKAPLLDLS